jgi:chemotaxis protein methyltransferase CheR
MIGPSLVAEFRTALVRGLGLQFDERRSDELARLLASRLERTGTRADRYLEALSPDELGVLAAALTVGESYFFRAPEQLRVLTEVAIPALVRARGPELRILSAGCSTGEEPYSIAIGLAERPEAVARVHGFDVNPASIAKAMLGRYSAWSLRQTPDATRARWFHRRGADFVVDGRILGAVTLDVGNLASPDPGLWAPASWDVVFCRNVTMYFAPDVTRAVVERIADALVPGGYLFLGHAETLHGVSDRFDLRQTHDTFYYQRKAPVVAPPPVDPEPRRREPSSPVRVPARPRSYATEIARATELLERERFADALALVDGIEGGDRELQLLQAVLLVHNGALERAEGVCAALLEAEPLDPGAHYVLALCREGANDPVGALEQDRLAIHREPEFAMPHLHLGLVARRLADTATAKRELAQALVLLQREKESRVILFGGGFGRDALMALCRAELAALGAGP